MNGLDNVIAVITGFSVLCSLPFIKPLYQAYRRAQASRLTHSMAKVNEPMVNAYKKQLSLIKQEIDTIKKSQVAELHDQIYREGTRLLEQGHLTVDELDNFTHLFRAYSALGGNGTGEAMYNRVTQLPFSSTKHKSLVDEAQEMHERRENEE